jgi:hypothetical protein
MITPEKKNEARRGLELERRIYKNKQLNFLRKSRTSELDQALSLVLD